MPERVIAAIYCRVSTDTQKENFSIPYQKDRLTKYCNAMDYTIYNSYIDGGFSGGDLDRPAMQQMLRDARAHKFNKIIVLKLDRFSRDLLDCYGTLKKLTADGISFLALDDGLDSTNEMIFPLLMAILAVFAEMERMKIKERFHDGKVQRAKSGMYYGGLKPYGYDYSRDDGLVVNEYEAAQVQQAFKLFLQGEPMRGVAKNLSKTFPGWEVPTKVKYVLSNRVYIGEVSYDGEWYKGNHQPIISQKDFDMAQLRLADISTSDKFKTQGSTYLLSGMIWCGQCGARYFAKKSTKRIKGVYKYSCYYKCYTRDATHKNLMTASSCKNKIYPVDTLDRIVLGEIAKLAINPDTIDEMSKGSIDTVEIDKRAAIEKRLKEIDTAINRYMSLYGQNSNLDPKYINDNVIPLQNEAKSLEEELLSTPKQEPIDIAPYKEAISQFHYAVEKNDNRLKRNIVDMLIRRVVIDNVVIKIYWKFCYNYGCTTCNVC